MIYIILSIGPKSSLNTTFKSIIIKKKANAVADTLFCFAQESQTKE